MEKHRALERGSDKRKFFFGGDKQWKNQIE